MMGLVPRAGSLSLAYLTLVSVDVETADSFVRHEETTTSTPRATTTFFMPAFYTRWHEGGARRHVHPD
jgi:hypothetical protein